ncbi:MAG TPA: hypothetical protein ENN09_01015, partial [Planctomycetes bacterium]|nr:hypothetical protein [Planctomycetota bacterium]
MENCGKAGYDCVMRRNVVISLFVIAAGAGVLLLVSTAAPPEAPGVDALRAAMPGSRIIAAGFSEEFRRPAEPRVFEVLVEPPAEAYVSAIVAADHAARLLRDIARVFAERGCAPGHSVIRVIMSPPGDVLLTDAVPANRTFERFYDELMSEIRLTEALGRPVTMQETGETGLPGFAVEGVSAKVAAALFGAIP